MNDNSKDNEILKINQLIKEKYSQKKNNEDNQATKKFIGIKRSANQLNESIKKETQQIKDSIENQEAELKKLQNDEIIFNQNILQVNIIDNQKKLINEYSEYNEELKLNLINLEKKLLEKDRSFKINNDELKKTLSRYISNYKKIEEELKLFKENEKDSKENENDSNELSLAKSKLEEMNSKIKFYQDENIRLSSEISKIKKNYETIKINLTGVENQKDDIFKKIKELNSSLTKNNIVGTPFVNESIEEDSINSEILNDIIDTNLDEEKKNNNKKNDLDELIGNIFK